MQYLFQYAVTYVPPDGEGESRVLIEPTTMLAPNAQVAERTAVRDVVDDGTLNWNYVRVIVAFFGGTG